MIATREGGAVRIYIVLDLNFNISIRILNYIGIDFYFLNKIYKYFLNSPYWQCLITQRLLVINIYWITLYELGSIQ